MAMNAAAIYNDSKIMTAKPEELTLMLLDGALKFSNIAMIGLEKNDAKKVHDNIIKAENIITELRETLNFKYEIAKSFDTMYEYINYRLYEANIHKDKVILEEAINFIREIRDTWKDAMNMAK